MELAYVNTPLILIPAISLPLFLLKDHWNLRAFPLGYEIWSTFLVSDLWALEINIKTSLAWVSWIVDTSSCWLGKVFHFIHTRELSQFNLLICIIQKLKLASRPGYLHTSIYSVPLEQLHSSFSLTLGVPRTTQVMETPILRREQPLTSKKSPWIFIRIRLKLIPRCEKWEGCRLDPYQGDHILQ